MKKNIKYLTICIIGSISFSLLFYFNFFYQIDSQSQINQADNENSNDVVLNLYLSVDYKNGTIDEWKNFNLTEGKTTVFDALVKWCNVKYKVYPNDQYYVITINGIGEGWIYKVNDNQPSVACNNYYLENGDKIEWIHV